jgi:amidohydrolase
MADDEHDVIERLTEQGLTRRSVLKAVGAVTAAAATGVATGAGPVEAATVASNMDSAAIRTQLASEHPAKATAIDWINQNRTTLTGLSDEIWANAELSLREWNSQLALATLLERNGFRIEWGTAGIAAAFIATWSNGNGPVLGFSGECDALPGLSQKRGVGVHDPLIYNYDPHAPSYGPGHGCAHNTLGTASAGAVVALKNAMTRNRVRGTLRYFGSSGEEQIVGKAFAVRAGAYDGLDAFLDWHPLGINGTGWSGFSAIASVTFTFLGAAGHGGLPLGNKSGLDGVQVMTTLTEYLREKNVAPSGRFHYAVLQGGGAANVTPDITQVSYLVREATPERMQVLLNKIVTCARAAGDATQTEMHMRINSAVWHLLVNKAAAELVFDNMLQLGAPQHSAASHELARRIQASLGVPQLGMANGIVPLTPPGPNLGGPSTDSADVSWNVPTLMFFAATNALGAPNHSWAITATAGAEAAHTGMLFAAKVLASTAVDLLVQPERLVEIKSEFDARKAGIQWKSLLPDDAQPPLYEPPRWFLERTRQSWPPPGVVWPPEPVISQVKVGTTGPPVPAP